MVKVTFTLDDGIHTPTIFEFNTVAAGSGHVLVLYTAGDTQVQVRTSVVQAINLVVGAPDPLLITAQAVTGGIINIKHDWNTVNGNGTNSESVMSTNFGITGVTGGTGGNCATNVGCSSDNDCISHTCVIATHKCL